MSMANKAKSLVNRFPSPAENAIRQIYVRRRFKTELELIHGTHRNDNAHQSIIHFSFNKAATQYVKSILKRCARANGMVPIAIPDFAFNSDFPRLHRVPVEEVAKHQHIFKQRGYVYTAFAGMVEGIPHLGQYKVVLVTRDPRDILVSGYYSVSYSHRAPSKTGNKYEDFMDQRRTARRLTVDEFVIAESGRVYDEFARYERLLLEEHPSTYLTSYEAMVSDFGGWLHGLAEYCELNISRGLFDSLVREQVRITPRREDVHRHVRKGRPGDYAEKLSVDTIDHLDAIFAPMLLRFGYHTGVRNVR